MEALRSDFHLMFNNARTYNQEGSIVWIDAEELQHVFDATYERVLKELEGLPSGRESSGPLAKEERDEISENMLSISDNVTENTPNDAVVDERGQEDGNSDASRPKSGMKIKLSMAGRRKQ